MFLSTLHTHFHDGVSGSRMHIFCLSLLKRRVRALADFARALASTFSAPVLSLWVLLGLFFLALTGLDLDVPAPELDPVAVSGSAIVAASVTSFVAGLDPTEVATMEVDLVEAANIDGALTGEVELCKQ